MRGCRPFLSAVWMVLVSAARTSGWPYWPVLPMLMEKSEAPNCTMSMPGTDRMASRLSTHDFVQRIDVSRRAALAHDADVAPHADAQKAAAAHALGHGRLRAHGVHGRPGVLDGADVGEQHALEARADRPHRLVGVLRLLDLDHAGQAGELEGAAEIVEVVQVERRVLGGKLDIVVLLGMADQLDQGRPGREDVRADGRLAGIQAFTKQIAAHGVSPLWLARIVRDRLDLGKR